MRRTELTFANILLNVYFISGELIGMDYLLSQTGKSTLPMVVNEDDDEADEEDAGLDQYEEDRTVSTLEIAGYISSFIL